MMSPLSSISLSGMNAAQVGMRTSAHNIANLGTEGFRRQQVLQSASAEGGVSTSLLRADAPGHSVESDLVGLLQAKNGFLANLAVFRTSHQMMGSLLDVTG